jgi:nitroreductase
MDLYEAILNRRSHRFYKPEMPPREALERVVNAGLWAPSGTNAQAWELTVLAGKPRDEFVALCRGSLPYMEPILERSGLTEERRQLVRGFFKNLGGAPVVIAVTVPQTPEPEMQMAIIQSGAALMQNLLLAAHAEGLGSCWMTGVLFVEKQLLEFLGKPGQQLLAITPIGYSAKEPPVPPRKDREVKWLGFE